MRAWLAAVAAVSWIQLYAPAAVAQSADFKPPAVGTTFEWKYNGGPGRSTQITAVSGHVITSQNGAGIRHVYGGFQPLESSDGTDLRLNVSKLDTLWPLSVGKSVSVEAQYAQYASQIDLKVVAYEKVTVAAGTFDAFVIERDDRNLGSVFGYSYSAVTRSWFAPSVGYAVKWDYQVTGGQRAGTHTFAEVAAIHAP